MRSRPLPTALLLALLLAATATAGAPAAGLLVETWDVDSRAAWDARATCDAVPETRVEAGRWSARPTIPFVDSCLQMTRDVVAPSGVVTVRSLVQHAIPLAPDPPFGSTMVGVASAKTHAGAWIDVQAQADAVEFHLVDKTGWHNMGGVADPRSPFLLRLDVRADGRVDAVVQRPNGSVVAQGAGRIDPLPGELEADVRVTLAGVETSIGCVIMAPSALGTAPRALPC